MLKTIISLLLLNSFLLFAQDTDKFFELMGEKKYFEAVKLGPSVSSSNMKNLQIQLLVGDAFYENENWGEALKYYKIAEELDDEVPEVLVKVGRSLHRTGKKEEAFEYFDEALDEDDEYMPIYIEYAEAHIRDGNIGEAQKWVDKGKDEDDENVDLLLTSGNMYFEKTIYELAKNEYLEALKIDSTNTEVRFKLATSYYWLGNRSASQELANEFFKKALQEWQRVTEEDPFNTKALYQSGKILFWAGRDKDAAPRLNRLVQLMPENKLGRWYLAQSLSNLGICDSAAMHLKWSSENIDSVRIKAKMMLAQCYVDNKDFENAVMTFKELEKDTTFGLKEYKMLGASAISIGDTAQAIEAWNKSIDINPDANCGVMLSLGQLYFVKKNYDKALEYFNKKLSTEKCDDAETNAKAIRFSALAYTYQANKEGIEAAKKTELLTKAEGLINEAFANYGEEASLKLTLGDVYIGLGKNDEAYKTYQSVIETGDKEKDAGIIKAAYAKVSNSYYSSKDWKKLSGFAEKWFAFDPTSTTAALYAAICYQNLYISTENDLYLEKACKWYNTLNDLDPGNKYATQFLDQGYCE